MKMTTEKVFEQLEFTKVLNYIAKYSLTEDGKELILNSRPTNNIEYAKKIGNRISEAKEILIANDIPPIDYIPELDPVLSRSGVEGAVLQKDALLDVYKLAVMSRRIYSFFNSRATDSEIKTELVSNLFIDKVFEHHFEKVFNEKGEIRDNASSKLQDIRKSIKEKNDNLRKVVNSILKRLSDSAIVQDEYVTQRDGRLVLPIKASNKRQVKGFIHSESATGQTVYIEPEETLELNNDILSLGFEEKRELDRIFKNLTKIIGEVRNELRTTLKVISELDLYFAGAKYSIEIIGDFPIITGEDNINVIDARHPVLIKKLGRDKTIPLNIKTKEKNVILITGPNAGGKTVVLKTLGIISALVNCGYHVPLHPDSVIPYFNNILVDIGDQQSIEDDLSTFSSHLTNMKNILINADDKSLILLDEVGTGTDPSEGSALAIAMLIELQQKGSFVLATTHHGNIKLVANELEGFENGSMEFDSDNLAPTYRFRQGIPGSSYAFEVAQRIGFETGLLDAARNYIDTDKSKIEDFLIELEKKANDFKQKLSTVEIENSRLKGLTKLYEEKVSTLEKQKKDILKDAKYKAENYLQDVNKKVEAAIKNIKESNAKKEVVKEEKKVIENLKATAKKLVPEKQDNGTNFNKKDLAIGDAVKLIDTDTTGTIVSINKERKRAIIQSGSIKLQVKINQLVGIKPVKEKKETTYSTYSYSPILESRKLDIRGKKPEEAEFEIMKFIDDAYAASAGKIEILHGKGTGVLKRTVHDIAKHHESVKDYYFEKIELGGDGITIVELK